MPGITAARGNSRYDANTMTSEITPHIADPSSVLPEQFAPAKDVLEQAIAERIFPGCAFGVLKDDRVVLKGALGHFTYEDESPAVTPHTVYDVASLTKVVATTAMAMLLAQRGALDLDTPLADLLPGFIIGRAAGSLARHVKLRHLLAHSSGLPGYVEFFRTHTTPAGIFRACLELPIETPPGERAEYSDPGFILLGKALEVLTGEHLPRWTHREVFHPMGMRATTFHPQPSSRGAIPPTEVDTTFRRRTVEGEVQDENAWILGGAAGHAGLFSNVPDLLQFAGEILRSAQRDSAHPSPKLFDRETIVRFAQRQAPEGSSRALGWDTPSESSSSGRHFSKHSIGHLGYSGCSLWLDLEADVAIVLLTNRTWPDRKSQGIREVRPRFHDAVREVL